MHPSSHYKRHRLPWSGCPPTPSRNASPPGGKSSLLYRYSDAEPRPYRRPSGSGNLCRCSLQPGIPSYPGRSSRLRRYLRSPSPALQTDPWLEISPNRTKRCAPWYEAHPCCQMAGYGIRYRIPCSHRHSRAGTLSLPSSYVPEEFPRNSALLRVFHSRSDSSSNLLLSCCLSFLWNDSTAHTDICWIVTVHAYVTSNVESHLFFFFTVFP